MHQLDLVHMFWIEVLSEGFWNQCCFWSHLAIIKSVLNGIKRFVNILFRYIRDFNFVRWRNLNFEKLSINSKTKNVHKIRTVPKSIRNIIEKRTIYITTDKSVIAHIPGLVKALQVQSWRGYISFIGPIPENKYDRESIQTSSYAQKKHVIKHR